MSLCRAAGLSIVALLSASAAVADVRGVRSPPSFTTAEVELIGRDQRLVAAVRPCAWQLREALDALGDADHGSRLGVRLEPCIIGGRDRASDEGALDILTILKEASGQGPNRAGQPTHTVSATPADGPSFTSEEMVLIYRDSKLKAALPGCAWQVRQALDSLLHGVQTGQPVRPCRTGGETSRGSDEGALDILKILREASGESTNN